MTDPDNMTDPGLAILILLGLWVLSTGAFALIIKPTKFELKHRIRTYKEWRKEVGLAARLYLGLAIGFLLVVAIGDALSK